MAAPHGPGDTPAGWYADPGGNEQQRYWDGVRWTEHVAGGDAPQVGRAPAPTTDQVLYRRTDFGAVVENLLTFDGVILEIFGQTQTSSGSQQGQRFHRDLMTITIEAPDRTGDRRVRIKTSGAFCQFDVAEQDRPVIDFLERVRAALPQA
jgi:hypothetical protein